jgi:membrane-associated protein
MVDIGAWADGVLAGLAGLDPAMLAATTAGFTALETTLGIGLVVPGDLIVLLGGSTVDSPARFALVALAAAGGTLIGELTGYAIGRLTGGRLRASWLGRRLGEERWVRAEKYLAGRGAQVLVPIRFVSVLHAVAPVVAGTVRMPFGKFLTWASIGAAVWATSYTALGAAVGSSYRQYGHAGLIASLCILGFVGAVLSARPMLRRRRGAAAAASPDSRPDDGVRVNGRAGEHASAARLARPMQPAGPTAREPCNRGIP